MVEKNDDLVMEYRHEMLNNRKYKGTARFVKEFMPSWISYVKNNTDTKSTVSSKGSDALSSMEDEYAEKRQSKVKKQQATPTTEA